MVGKGKKSSSINEFWYIWLPVVEGLFRMFFKGTMNKNLELKSNWNRIGRTPYSTFCGF